MTASAAPAQTAAAPPVRIAAPDSAAERDADRIADAVIRGRSVAAPSAPGGPPAIHRKCAGCSAGGAPCASCAEDELKLKRSGGAAAIAPAAAATAAAAVSGGGQPLSPTARSYFEPRFGADLSDVRVHTGTRAARAAQGIGAKAYAYGRNIAFAPGRHVPETGEGRRLMAHELAHVQAHAAHMSGSNLFRAPAPDVINEDTEPVAPSAGPTPATSDGKDQETDAGDAGGKGGAETPDGDVTQVHDRVDKVLVSCPTERIGFVTAGATYVYQLTSDCGEGASDSVIAKVERDAEQNTLDFSAIGADAEEDPSGGHRSFEFEWRIGAGEIDPVDLFHEQDTVLIEYVERIGSRDPDDPRTEECILTRPPTTVFKGGSDTRDLLDFLPTKTIDDSLDLADFGFANIELKVGGSIEADAQWTLSDGKVTDICLSSADGDGLYKGWAKFSVDGNIGVHFGVEGYVKAAANLLRFIEVLSVGGALRLDADAGVDGKLETPAEVAYNPRKPSDGLQLLTKIDFATLSRLAMNLSASAGIDMLGFSLLEADFPELYKLERAYAWTGGMTFDNSFLPQVELGTIERATEAQLLAAPESGPGTAAKRAKRKKAGIQVGNIVRAALGFGDGEPAFSGLSCEDALPLTWFKPRGLYQDALEFDPAVHPGVTPTTVGREETPPVRVSHDTVQPRFGSEIVGPTPFGVDDKNWPEFGPWAKCFQYIKPKSKPRRESRKFRDLVQALGHDVDPVQIDHVRELEFGGADRFDNLWPMDSSANQSAGRLHQAQFQAYEALFENINGRHFRIVSIGLDLVLDKLRLPPADNE